uniref:Uncharacterized protein n=1 Tax=Megaselia scalaris TaxID=36166 RepID=T1GTA1_MEGSC
MKQHSKKTRQVVSKDSEQPYELFHVLNCQRFLAGRCNVVQLLQYVVKDYYEKRSKYIFMQNLKKSLGLKILLKHL